MSKLSFIVHDKVHKKTIVLLFDTPSENQILKTQRKVELYGEI